MKGWLLFGALQIGELVNPSTVRAGGIWEEDVDLYQDRVEFCLWRSKTDQVDRGQRVVLFASGSALCPVQCLHRFRSLRGCGVLP